MTIAIVGEAPGEMEQIEGRPFVGPSGKLLNDLLSKANISRDECLITNVFEERPPRNDVSYFFQARKNNKSSYPPYNGKLLKSEHEHHLIRLHNLIDASSVNIIIALGATALWALTSKNGIKNFRGVTMNARGKKLIASYHPAAVLRDYSLRPILFSDLIKAKKNDNTKPLQRTQRSIWIAESLADVILFRPRIEKCIAFTFDVETIQDHITHIAVATSRNSSICVPFRTNNDTPLYSVEDECDLWTEVQQWFLGDAVKIAHNSLYDLTHLYNQGLIVKPPIVDTMLLAHAAQPELPKSLGFLGSLKCDEDAWKEMRVKPLIDEDKSEE